MPLHCSFRIWPLVMVLLPELASRAAERCSPCYRIRGFHSSSYEEFSRLGYNVMSSFESQPTLWGNVHPSCCLLHPGFLLGLGIFSGPEDGGDGPPKHRLTFRGLRGVISKKLELFIPLCFEIMFFFCNPISFEICISRGVLVSTLIHAIVYVFIHSAIV
jgi:hypothetical protein